MGKSPFSKRLAGWCKEFRNTDKQKVFHMSPAVSSVKSNVGGSCSRLENNIMHSLGCVNPIFRTVLWTQLSFLWSQSPKHSLPSDARKCILSIGHVPFIVLITQQGCECCVPETHTRSGFRTASAKHLGTLGAKVDVETSITELLGTSSQTDVGLKWAAVFL